MGKTSFANWLAGARPRTLTASVAPVVVGTALAGTSWVPNRAALALAVALALQIGVNYANDYSDGIRGTDSERVGPVRLVGQGLATPRAVLAAAWLCFFAAATCGLILVALTGHWWLLAVGACAVAAAWFYTGGRHPYGYAGLGEIFVFVFFGIVPVLGTLYVQTDNVTSAAIAAGVGMGAFAAAILITNNLRDIPTDRAAGKKTFAVRLGDRPTRLAYLLLVAIAYLSVPVVAFFTGPWALLGLASMPMIISPVRTILSGSTGRVLVPALVRTGTTVGVYAACLSIGLIFGDVFRDVFSA